MRFLFLTSCLLFLLICNAVFGQGANPNHPRIQEVVWQGQRVEILAQQLLVKLNPGVSVEAARGVIRSYGGVVIKSFHPQRRWGKIQLPVEINLLDAITELEAHPLFQSCAPNVVIRPFSVPNDPDFVLQWALENVGQLPSNGTPGADISALNAWEYGTGNSDVLIAVLDSGIPLDSTGKLLHPDLNDTSRFLLGEDFLPPGFGNAPGVKDELGHGTHVLGIIGAESNNSLGIAGITWNTRIMIFQVLSAGWGGMGAMAEGIWAAVDSGAAVINISGGALVDHHPMVEDAVAAAQVNNVLICAAAGNNGMNWVGFPANLNTAFDNVIAVAATDHNDLRAPYSNYGGGWSGWVVDIGAPGGFGGVINGDDIWSTLPGYETPYTPNGESYGYLWGTSMATPHVTGAAALLLSVNPNLTPAEIREVLTLTADEVSGQTWGRLNMHHALEQTVTQISANQPIPEEFLLHGNYPNPFNPSTTIEFTIPEAAEVRLTIYNALGQEVATLVNGRLSAGQHRFTWQAKDMPSGVYFYRLENSPFRKGEKRDVQTRKMLLMK